MRVLALETSTRRGSVALLEDDRLVESAHHETLSAHAERVLSLIDELFARVGWNKGSLDRIGVGVGPGAFTGIRVGIALAQGLGLGLDRPVFGVGSLEAMAAAVPAELEGTRVALLDARRGEIFAAAFDRMGVPLAPIATLARDAVAASLAPFAGQPVVVVGEVGAELGLTALHRSPETDLPHAELTARLAAKRPADLATAAPQYVRDAGAVLPKLPPSPLRE